MQRSLLPILGLIFLAGLALIFVYSPPGGPADGDGLAAPPPPPPSEAAAAETVGRNPAEQARTELPGAAVAPRAEATPWADPPRGITLRLVRAEGGVPCPGAELHVLAEDTLVEEAFQIEIRTGGARTEAFARHGRFYRANEKGRVVLPRPRHALLLRAEHEGLVGDATIRDPRGGMEFTLELAQPQAIEVLVVDQAGAPAAAVPVSLVAGVGSRIRRLLTATTDAEGRSWLREAGIRFRDEPKPPVRVTVRLDLLLEQAVEQIIDPEALPADPVRLVLPPTGELAVRLLDPRGNPLTASLPVLLARDRDPDRLPSTSRSRSKAIRVPFGRVEPAVDGLAVFRHVGLGLRFEVSAAAGGTQYLDAMKGPGPTEANTRAELVLRPQDGRRILVGRLLLPDGLPPPPKAVQGIYLAGRDTFNGWRREGVRTEQDGGFRIAIREALPLPATLVLLHPGAGDGQAWEAALPLSSELPPGITDFGELSLRPAPLLVGGRVLGGDGGPADRTEIWVRYRPDPGASATCTLWSLRRFTDLDGSFRILGRLPGVSKATLVVRPDEGPLVFQAFAPGTDGLVIQIAETGALAGSLLLDPSVPAPWLRVAWKPDPERSGPSAPLRLDGSFELSGLTVGSGRLEVQFQNQEGSSSSDLDALWTRKLEILPGPAREDPGLQGIDLRSFRTHRLTLSSLEEVRLPLIVAKPAGESGPVFTSSDPVLLIPSWLGFRDWELSARGFRSQTVEGLVQDRSVELKPAIKVELQVAEGSLPEGCSLVVSAEGPGVLANAPGARAFLFRRKAAVFYFQRPGSHELSYQLLHEGSLPARHRFPAGCGIQPSRIEVSEDPGEQSFTVIIPPEALAAGLEALKRGGG